MKSTIDRLIINSPYEEPAHYWSYERETRFFSLKDGRRPAGYIVATEHSKAFDDPGKFIEIPLVLEIKGQDTQQDRTKREFLDEWVKAVNQHGGFGVWQWAVSRNSADVAGIIKTISSFVQ